LARRAELRPLRATGIIDVVDCAEREFVVMQSPQGPYRPPPPAYPDQDLAPLMRRVPQLRAQDGTAIVPAVRLDLITVRNGWFAVGNGLDGVILTEDRALVSEAAMFSAPGRAHLADTELALPCVEPQFENVFVGFDASWTNWYHWLCFALPRSALAARLLPRTCPIVLPAYAVRAAATGIRFSEVTWRQSLEAFGLADRATLLPPGLYRAKAIRFLWTTPREPTNLTLLRDFHDLFAAVRRGLRRNPQLPRRILISRETGVDRRITQDETAHLNRAAAQHGSTKVNFETMDFAEQTQAVFNADAALGVHGAGLANILFGHEDLKVLEINRPLDGGILLRPWFYLLAHTRRIQYRFLNSATGDVTEQRIAEALEALEHG
jgi:hypothetical protein